MKNKFSILVVVLVFLSSFLFSRANSKITHYVVHAEITNYFNQVFKPQVDLVVYLHGAGTDERYIYAPFTVGGIEVHENLKNYRRNLLFISFLFQPQKHWSSLEDAKDLISKLKILQWKYNIRKIIFVGMSVGGSLALNTLSLADSNLQKKITDVVSVFPIVDYQYTIKHTKRKNIYDDLKVHFSMSNDPALFMKESSPITYISKIPKHTKIFLIKGSKDTHVCSNQIDKYYEELKRAGKNVELQTYDMDHDLFQNGERFGNLIKSILK